VAGCFENCICELYRVKREDMADVTQSPKGNSRKVAQRLGIY
jgi:hypothetical protein